MRIVTFLIALSFASAANSVANAAFITGPTDAVTGFYETGATGPGQDDTPSTVGSGANQYPAAESPPNAVDGNTATKYLNFGAGGANSTTIGVGTGFYDTLAAGSSIATAIQVATANDSATRDPITVSIEGTNATSGFDTGATWTLIADNVDLGIDTDPGRLTFGPVVSFANSTAYTSYRIIVESQRGSDNSVQYSEMNLLPEPASFGLLGIASVGLLVRRRRI
jgi:hypothetical protein